MGQTEPEQHPFLCYAFLKALEDSGSVGGQTGWDMLFLAAREDSSDLLVGVLPAISNIILMVNMYSIIVGPMRLSALVGAIIQSCYAPFLLHQYLGLAFYMIIVTLKLLSACWGH